MRYKTPRGIELQVQMRRRVETEVLVSRGGTPAAWSRKLEKTKRDNMLLRWHDVRTESERGENGMIQLLDYYPSRGNI
jgi:hypothetical protein